MNLNLNFNADTIFGGTLLSVKCGNSLNFYDWETGICIRRIEVEAKNVCKINIIYIYIYLFKYIQI